VSVRVIRKTRGVVGENVRRVDGVPKVKGQFLFGSDLWAEEMLWGHTVRSPHPSARVRSINISKALKYSGVAAVLLAGDVPGKKTYGLEFADQPVLAGDRVRYAGEPVAILAAIDPETARRAADLITIAYEILPAVTDMEQALRPDAPKVHDFGNVLRHITIEHGDPRPSADLDDSSVRLGERMVELATLRRQEAERYLVKVAEPMKEKGLRVECEVHQGSPAETIAAFAAHARADLIAMTTHARGGLERLFFGSVAEGVLRHASVPVLLLKAGRIEP